MAEMFTSASDITSNPGNAALGYSGGGVGYSTNPADSNPGAPIQSVLGQIAQTEERKRIAEKQRQQKEQDELAAYLASTGESVFNMKGPDGKSSGFTMLPQDREYVNERVNEIRNKVISEPDTYKFDADLKAKEQELKQLTDLAGIRATEVAKRKVLAASTNDMRERERILKSIEDIEKEPVYSFKTPDAYLPSATWDIEGLGISKDVLSGKIKDGWDDIAVGTEKDANGNEIIISQPGIRGSILDTRNRMVRGSKEFTNAENMVKAMYANPNAVSPASILQLNQGIANYNKLRGYKPGDANYAPPVGEVFPDGTVELPELNDSTIPDIAYGLLAQKSGQAGIAKEIKKTKSELDKEKSAMKVAEGNLAVNRGQLDLAWAKFNRGEKEMTKVEAAERRAELNAMTDAVDIYEMLTADAKPKNMDFSIPETKRTIKETILENTGLDVGQYNVSDLPGSDVTITNIAGARSFDAKGQPGKVSIKPKFAYRFTPKNGDISQTKLVFGYKINKPMVDDETGEVVMDKKSGGKLPKMQEVLEWKIQTPEEAIATRSMASNNFNNKSAAEIDRDARAKEMLKSMFSQKSTTNTPSTQKQPTAAPAYKVKGTEIIGPDLSSVLDADIKTVNGVDMLRYNGTWRKIVSRDEKNRLILE